MPKYLLKARYTPQGMKGVLSEGGTGRRETIAKMIADVGGSLEAFYFALGEDDVILIADVPDNVTTASIGMLVSASGSVTSRTTVLLTPEEIDQAAQLQVDYRPPGG
ncbi:GYD domain-containing protein [Egicoccus sp. AB-alg2]|uniref:GYD domain-containing protein n=1 Tax=Egicoccus sp. AB-alg2 TaxID=3242693 RepID=UPI00359E7650